MCTTPSSDSFGKYIFSIIGSSTCPFLVSVCFQCFDVLMCDVSPELAATRWEIYDSMTETDRYKRLTYVSCVVGSTNWFTCRGIVAFTFIIDQLCILGRPADSRRNAGPAKQLIKSSYERSRKQSSIIGGVYVHTFCVLENNIIRKFRTKRVIISLIISVKQSGSLACQLCASLC